MKRACLLVIPLALWAVQLRAQSSLEAECARPEVAMLGAVDECYAAVQAALSAQPALGLVITGGNPTPGTAGGTGLRLGMVPRTSVGARANVVGVKLPDILAGGIPGTLGDVTDRFGAPVPALIFDLSLGITQGASLAPGLSGIGALSFLGSATYLPFQTLGIDGFSNSPEIAWGAGLRLHLLQESFVAPGVALSVMRRGVGTVQFGDICEGINPGEGSEGMGSCLADGDPGEVRFNLVDWSGRLVASKHLLGLGLTAGLGYDRYGSELAFGFRSPESSMEVPATTIFRFRGHDLDSSRWTAFGNLSYTLIFGTLALEGGWQQGKRPIAGFEEIDSDFDPESGTWFGSLGVRLAL